MMGRKWIAAALCFSLMPLTGCTYTKNRVKDFFDPLSVGMGLGIGASIRATNYVQVGANFTGKQARLIGPTLLFPLWFVDGIGFSRRVEAPVGPGVEFGLAPIYYFRGIEMPNEKDSVRTVLLAKTQLDPQRDKFWKQWYRGDIWSFFPGMASFESDYDRRFFDFGISFFGFDLDFNPYELVDFIVGFTTLDISDDDMHEQVMETASAPTNG